MIHVIKHDMDPNSNVNYRRKIGPVYEQAKQGKVVGIWHRTELASISHPSTMGSFAEYRLNF